MRFSFRMLLMFAAATVSLGLFAAPITGKDYSIVIPDNATPTERTAALELGLYLVRVTGERVPVVAESQHTASQKGIFVGKCAYTQKSGKVDFDKLEHDGIHLVSQDGNLMLAGNRRGVLYAVYEFLERYADCRWYASDCIVIPEKKGLAVPEVDYCYVPRLKYRENNYFRRRSIPSLVVASRLNPGSLPAEWGGGYRYEGFVHTFLTLVPPEVYGADHPEYFSEIDGKRVTKGRTQLCLTNPDVLQIVIKEVKARLRRTPDAIVSVSQMDWHKEHCRCKNCSELAEKEGSHSGPLLYFVNEVARAVKKDFPNALIDTLAYTYTRKPPKTIKAESNVIIRLCSIECCFAHPLENDPYNASFARDLKEWSKYCSQLFVWDYTINFHYTETPFPNFRVLAPNIRFFTENSVVGLFEQSNGFCPGGEFDQLRAYLVSRCLWDPSYDVEKGIVEFTDAYYGAAAPHIRAYIKLMHDYVTKNTERHLRIYDRPSKHYDKKIMDAAMEHLTLAEASVIDDPVLHARVEETLLPVFYVRIAGYMDDDAKRNELLDRFEKITNAIPGIRLGESPATTVARFLKEQRLGKGAKHSYNYY